MLLHVKTRQTDRQTQRDRDTDRQTQRDRDTERQPALQLTRSNILVKFHTYSCTERVRDLTQMSLKFMLTITDQG